MKPVKLLALCLALLFCLPFLLVSCGERSGVSGNELKKLPFKTVVDTSLPFAEIGLYRIEKINPEGNVVGKHRVLVVFQSVDHLRNEQTYEIFHTERNRSVYRETFSLSDTVSVQIRSFTTCFTEIFTVKRTGTDAEGNIFFTTALHAEDGTELASVNRDETPRFNYNFLFFADRAFREVYEQGVHTVRELETFEPENRFYESIETKTRDYCYTKANVNGYVRVYDMELQPVYTFIPDPKPAEIYPPIPLQNGNFLIQLFYPQPDDAEDYTAIFQNGIRPELRNQKIRLQTLLVDIHTGAETELDFPYILGRSSFETERPMGRRDAASLSYLNWKKLGTVLIALPLGNGHPAVDLHAIQPCKLAMDEHGNLLGRIDAFVDSQRSNEFPERVSESFYLVNLSDGAKALLHRSGMLLNANLPQDAIFLEDYVIAEHRIYNKNLKMVLDTEEEGLQIHSYGVKTVILGGDSRKNPGEYAYFLLVNGKLIELDDGYTGDPDQDLTSYGGIHVLKKARQGSVMKDYLVYNENGELQVAAQNANFYTVHDYDFRQPGIRQNATVFCFEVHMKNGPTIPQYYLVTPANAS